jgi:hypothetical protein
MRNTLKITSAMFKLFLKFIFGPLLYIIPIVVFPFLLLRELRNLAAFFIFIIWRNRRAKFFAETYGDAAAQSFLRDFPANYSAFCNGGK